MKKILVITSLFLSTTLFSQCVDTVWIPTAFTPGGNNSQFFPVTPGQNDYEINIFNRSGNFIFQSQNQPWDGNSNQGPCQDGTYVYMIRVFGDGCYRKLTGTITLIR